jgi:hypothetical protein
VAPTSSHDRLHRAAGIIGPNAMLLVDCIRHCRIPGQPLAETLIEARAIRSEPILLTALAAGSRSRSLRARLVDAADGSGDPGGLPVLRT